MTWKSRNLFQFSESTYGFLFPDHDDLGNAGFVITEEGIVVIDTDIRSVDLLFETLSEMTDKPVTYLVNTHHAFDHTSANCIFAEKGVTIIGSEQCRREMLHHGENNIQRWKDRKPDIKKIIEQKAIRVALPKLTFDHELRLSLGSHVLEMFFYGHAHTPGDIAVYLPNEQILFGGDLLWFGLFPNVREANIPNQIRIVNRLLQFPARYYVPGHGHISQDPSELVRMRDFLKDLYESIHAMAADNKDLDEIKKLETSWAKKYPGWRARQFLSRAIPVIFENCKNQRT